MEPATTTRFALAARELAQAARSAGLTAPSFRSPPRLVGADRTLRTRAGRATVAIRVRGRPWVPVLADMIEGIVAANRLVGPPADRAREALWRAITAVGSGNVGAARPAGPAVLMEAVPPAAGGRPGADPPAAPDEARWVA